MFGKLSELATIHCHGKDSKDFLQGQLTCNLKLLKNEVNKNSKLAAHCSPKGRMISLFRLIYQNEQNYYLILPKSMVEITLSNLSKYAVFSEVILEDVTKNILLIGYDNNDQNSKEKDSHCPELKVDYKIVTTELNSNMQLSLYQNINLNTGIQIAFKDISEYWHLLNIQNGIPAIYPETSDKFIPQRLNLQELGGLSFKKGCYIGQEVLSRLYYRGVVKYKMVLGEAELSPPFTPGEKIVDQDKKSIGHLVDSIIYNNNTYLLFEINILADKNYLFILHSKIKLLTLPYEDKKT